MTSLVKNKRFLIDRDLTASDIEQMEYWSKVKEAETERCIRVLNHWDQQKQQEKTNATNHH